MTRARATLVTPNLAESEALTGILPRSPHTMRNAAQAWPKWRNTPAPSRGRILLEAARLMDKHREELARLISLEEGKALKDSRGEVQRSINITEFMSGEGRRFGGYTSGSESATKFAFTTRQPLGVVACITPWNFPLAIPAWKIAPALVAGNAVILKPASATPASAVRLAELYQEAGLPDGVSPDGRREGIADIDLDIDGIATSPGKYTRFKIGLPRIRMIVCEPIEVAPTRPTVAAAKELTARIEHAIEAARAPYGPPAHAWYPEEKVA